MWTLFKLMDLIKTARTTKRKKKRSVILLVTDAAAVAADMLIVQPSKHSSHCMQPYSAKQGVSL